jgi:hypothetical protein
VGGLREGDATERELERYIYIVRERVQGREGGREGRREGGMKNRVGEDIPPLSAIDSPRVRRPLTCTPYSTNDENSSDIHLARALKLATTCGVYEAFSYSCMRPQATGA